jgi:uncharacterized protein YfkK (UPF0435 family)
MDLTEKTQDNIDYMINAIKDRLHLVNEGVIRSENYAIEQYEDIRDIYEYVTSKNSISVNEMEAVLGELGNLRKK